MVSYIQYASPLGQLLLTAQGGVLTGIWMDREAPETGVCDHTHPVLLGAKAWLDGYFQRKPLPVTLPLAPEGTPFQRWVWDRLLEIPWGACRTYGEIAKDWERQTGRRMSPQAIGGAVGKNPISIMIPCHRVVGAEGKLTGYAGGLDRKHWLLTHEGRKGREYDHQ